MYCIVKTIYIYNLSSKYRGLDSGVPCTGEQYRIPGKRLNILLNCNTK